MCAGINLVFFLIFLVLTGDSVSPRRTVERSPSNVATKATSAKPIQNVPTIQVDNQ